MKQPIYKTINKITDESIIKDGHTMLPADIIKDLERKNHLEKQMDKMKNMNLFTVRQIQEMRHAVGDKFTNPARNYFQVEKNPEWEYLVKKGYASSSTHFNQNAYHITQEGLDILKRILIY